MGTQYFSDVAKKVATRMEKVTKAERVVTEILERVFKDQNVPVPHFEVNTDDNVYLVYELKEAPKTSEMQVLITVFPGITNEGGSKLKIHYYDTF